MTRSSRGSVLSNFRRDTLLEGDQIVGIPGAFGFHQAGRVLPVVGMLPIILRAIREILVRASGEVGLHRRVIAREPFKLRGDQARIVLRLPEHFAFVWQVSVALYEGVSGTVRQLQFGNQQLRWSAVRVGCVRASGARTRIHGGESQTGARPHVRT